MTLAQRIGVLMGGVSSEREVSLKSGKAIYETLRSCGIDAVKIDIRHEKEDYIKDLIASYDIGLGFLALHGGSGEDGRIQKILEEINLPYTGSGPRPSSLAMDKIASRKIFEKAGLLVPRFYVLSKKCRRVKDFGFSPLVVKPACGGSSIGLSIIDKKEDLKEALSLAFRYDSRVLVEEYIEGREMTVGILEDKPLAPIEIRPKRKFFDYKAKYEKGATEYIVPAKLPGKISTLLKNAALKAHRLLGCAFFSRVDIILDKRMRPFVLEVNTIPGFTATSLLPMAASLSGISFQELVLKISQAALTDKDEVLTK